MIYNFFWALGPNVTGYPGGYPNGFLEKLARMPWWGSRRLHLCSGTVHDGITIDIKPELRPTVTADLDIGIPLRDECVDTVIIDPPYSQEKADELYGLPLVSVPRLLKEACRVCMPNGHVILLDLRVWPPVFVKHQLRWRALGSIYTANRGPKPLRALSVFQKQVYGRLETHS